MMRALSVKEFNEYFKTNIKHDPILTRVYISGSLANIRKSHNHLYFSLKEESDIIDCVIYYYEDADIDFNFAEGIDVELKGRLNYNNYSSRVVVAVSSIEEKGLSEAYLKFLKIKEDFHKKGYFDQANKLEIPKFPKNIGLITSKDGAAIVDFISVINQKPNDITIKLYPVKVQGAASAALIVDAIEALDKEDLDAIVITRGGGSSEDLAVFNEPAIIEAAFAAKTPIISAIGHKIDTTLLDLVADLSLQTPTEAGSYLIANYANIYTDMTKLIESMRKSLNETLRLYELRLSLANKSIRAANPKNEIEGKLKDLTKIKKDLDKAIRANISLYDSNLKLVATRLKAAKRVIEAQKKNIVITNTAGSKVYSKHSLKAGDEINLNFADGSVRAVVTDG